MGIEAVVAVAGAFIGGVAVLGASWRMIAYYDKTNREEHAALMRAIAVVGERVTDVEVRLGERIAAVEVKLGERIAAVEVKLGERMAGVEGKLDLLIAQQQKP